MPGDVVFFKDEGKSELEIEIEDPTTDEPGPTHNGAGMGGANLDDSVLLEPANPLSPDDLRALAGDMPERGKTPPPLILPPPQLGVPGMGLGMPPPPQRALGSPSRTNNPVISHHDLAPPHLTPPSGGGIRITPTTLIIMILGLVALGLGLGVLLATK
jgi:hypothetical protein